MNANLRLYLLCLISLLFVSLLTFVPGGTSANGPKGNGDRLASAKPERKPAERRAERDSVRERADRPEPIEAQPSSSRAKPGALTRVGSFFKNLLTPFKGRAAKPSEEQRGGDDEGDDPDRPTFMRGKISEADYIQARNDYVMMRLGMTPGLTYDPMIRVRAVEQMERQEARLREDARNGLVSPDINGTTWTNLGPYPIPNGQTSGVVQAVSGRTVAIAIHPTNPNLAYVGTAQGGVYRTTNGGATWTQLFNNAQSQVIGAIAIAPSNPEIVYVGTGEAGQCGSGCYAGIGVYRIDNASTTADLTGPINPLRNYNDAGGAPTSANIFTGRTISKILVNPTDPSIIFVATASGIVGNPQQAPFGGTVPPLGIRGIYRLANATGPAAGVTFTKLTISATNCFDLPCTGNMAVLDMVYDGLDATGNTIVCWLRPTTGAEGGVYRTTTALSTATFTNTLSQTATANSRGELASVTIAGVTTMYLANGESATGRIRQSVDGGQTWSATLAGASGFCGGQCFYDIAIAIDPTNANIAYVGGAAGSNILRKTTDGFASVANTPSMQTGLHADNHALAVANAPNNAIVYDGTDGGIWRTTDAAANWTSLNNSTFVATQFQSIAIHPTDRWFSIGGTQDNGTNFLQPNADILPFGGWTRADFGDGGYARIDQTAANTSAVVMYHTYFNQTNNLIGFSRVSNVSCATEGNWAFKGVGAGVFTNACGDVEGANGITGSDAVLFYAPLELGPVVAGSIGQTVYFGTDRLYRSINKGDTMTVVSSAPAAAIVAGVPITTIAIAPSDDNYRFVGLNNGNVWGSITGLPPFVNVTPPAAAPRAVGKIVIDPNNKNTAFVGYGGQFGAAASATEHIWKTTNLNVATPTWTAVGNGIPDVPVNALVVDPANSTHVYAGTDVGVFVSQNGGNNWVPFGSGLPRMAVFDMVLQNANRILRIATHGRGFWEITPLSPTAAPATISGRITTPDGSPVGGAVMHLSGARSMTTVTDGSGNYHFDNVDTDNFYTVTPQLANYHFAPASRSFSLVGNMTDAGFTANPDASQSANAIDMTEYFVRQQYLDFLGREPDQGGLEYWSAQINQCGGDANCIRNKRIDVSAAFFASAEFQQTGSYIYGVYAGTLGRTLNYSEFNVDRSQVLGGSGLEEAKTAFAKSFVERAEFTSRYPQGMTREQFVDAVIQTMTQRSGVDQSSLRAGFLSDYDSGGRALVVRHAAEASSFVAAEYNKAFVLMEYFGYLRREIDQGGYDYWLDVLNNGAAGNYRGMVCAFLTSSEYQLRFSTVVTRSNAECGP
jgi:photosystem II stability/assembly factor-like uncharacterized protein